MYPMFLCVKKGWSAVAMMMFQEMYRRQGSLLWYLLLEQLYNWKRCLARFWEQNMQLQVTALENFQHK